MTVRQKPLAPDADGEPPRPIYQAASNSARTAAEPSIFLGLV